MLHITYTEILEALSTPPTPAIMFITTKTTGQQSCDTTTIHHTSSVPLVEPMTTSTTPSPLLKQGVLVYI